MAEGTPDGPIVVWEPRSKPQAAYIACPVFEVFYGGSRGSLKTDGTLGDWLSHSDLYGKDAIGLMVRRERTQLKETIERAKEIYKPLGFDFSGYECVSPKGARLNFAYLERDEHAENYQGHSYCVAVGTQIRMADGSLRSIERIERGDLVQTLEGGRQVLATVRPYLAPCVRVLVRDVNGECLGVQTHPIWHPVLTSAGLIWSRSSQTRRSDGQLQSGGCAPCTRDEESHQRADQGIPAWRACSEGDRSGCTVSSHSPSNERLPVGSIVPVVVLHALRHQSKGVRGRVGLVESTRFHARGKLSELWSGLRQGWKCFWSDLRPLRGLVGSVLDRSCRGPSSDRACVPNGSTPVQGYQAGCPCDPCSCDGPIREDEGIGLDGTPSPSDVESTRHALPSGGSDTTQGHSRSAQQCWVHPYTGEAHRLSERVQIGTMEVAGYCEAYVSDLCVEHANHYISSTGLINKNTRVYIEELGNFPDQKPVMKLMATLRSARGVPCGFRGTGNPGGPGHLWVKARYIDPNPMGWQVIPTEFVNPYTGSKIMRERIFIPGKITDHNLLGDDYIANLMMSGSPELVRAWLEGDWSVIAGAFFPEFALGKHVVRPQELPSHWLRFVAADWGSARPFSVGWYAVSDGELSQFPRGALVRYREWYGMQDGKPNEGIRLHAEAWGEGIKARTPESERIAYFVIDPAALAQDGGPSIGERSGILWMPGDNKRVARAGMMGGWDQLRARLVGEDERPMLYFFSTNTHAIRTLPALQHDAKNPEDANSDQEDHAPDEIRLACMSRPYIRDNPTPQPVKFPIHRTINEMIEAKRRSRMAE